MLEAKRIAISPKLSSQEFKKAESQLNQLGATISPSNFDIEIIKKTVVASETTQATPEWLEFMIKFSIYEDPKYFSPLVSQPMSGMRVHCNYDVREEDAILLYGAVESLGGKMCKEFDQ